MRSFVRKGLFIPAIFITGAIYAYAAVDTQPSESNTVVTQQSVDSLPIGSKQATASQSTATSQNKPAESLSVTADAMPFQVAMVDGDYHKYEALNWQDRGYSGGVKDLSIHYTSGDDVTIDASGSGIIGNGDYKGAYSITKKDVGYMNFDFDQFRKYYDTFGGIFQGHSDSLSRDLSLDIGHIGFEAGIKMPDLPNVSVYYDHNYKNGSKSMLNWDTIKFGTVSQKISPSWEELDETTDTFGIKGDYTEKGYHLTGDQRFEIARWKTRGYEVRLGNGSATATDYDQRRQDQVQETNVMTTTLGADKWYWGDKIFGSSAYRFEHLKNQDRQNIQEFQSNGTPLLTALNKSDGSAHNDQDLNSWVLNLMISPWSWLSGTSGFKAEITQRDASSNYPSDLQTATTNYVALDNTESNTCKFAESFGLRFKAIPRTAVYTDLSFEQSQNHLMVNSRDINFETGTRTSDNQTRDAIIDEPVINWVTGADFQPFRRLNLTSQVRFQDKDMEFHDRFRITPFEGQVFLEKLHTTDLGLTQRATVRLSGWAQTSFRYLLDNTDYTTRAAYQNEDEKANMLSNTFIYDLSVYPLTNLSMTGSFTQRYDQTKTVLATQKPGTILVPAFTSDSSTWMFSTDYQPHDKVHLDGSLFYTIANNYNQNLPSSLINYAAAFNQLGLTVGCKWDLTKDLSVKPQYSFQRFLPNESNGIGSAYDAQIISLQVITTWG
jgi:hypothetical protein